MATPALVFPLALEAPLLLGGLGPLGVGALWVLAGATAATTAAFALRRLRAARARAETAERRERLLLRLLERDRRRLAQALHDGPVQDLLAHEMMAGMAPHVGGLPDAPSDDVAHVVRELRAVSEGLRPPALDAFGLAAAATAHAERFRERHAGIEVRLDLDPVDLGPHVRLALFRVVQEAFDNAALHGPPLHIAVTLRATADGAELTVVDDGAGYDVPEDLTAFAATGRYGLLGMRAHTEAVGAALHVESAPGRTAIRVAAPTHAPGLD